MLTRKEEKTVKNLMAPRWVRGGLVSLTIAFFFVLCSGFIYLQMNKDRVAIGVSLAGSDLSQKSREEVRALIDSNAARVDHQVLILQYKEHKWILRPDDIELTVDKEATFHEVWQIGHEGNLLKRMKDIWAARRYGKEVEWQITFNDKKLTSYVDNLAEQVNTAPVNATISLKDRKFIPERVGETLDTEASKARIISKLRAVDNRQVDLVVITQQPKTTIADLQEFGSAEPISEFYTFFDSSNINRSLNIELASQAISGTVLQPGQVFSFNDVVGPRTKEKGYKEALEIVNLEFVPGYGGGVCQVSSTLYNAVLLANLEVVERTNHARPLSYLPLGRDATVSYGSLDFKFRNSLPVKIMLIAEVNGNQLTTAIFGKKPIDEDVEIYTSDQKVIDFQTVTENDPNLPVGTTKVEEEGSPGYDISVWRVVRVNGQVVKHELLSKDRYFPIDKKVKVGTKKGAGEGLPKLPVTQPPATPPSSPGTLQLPVNPQVPPAPPAPPVREEPQLPTEDGPVS